MKTSGEFRLLHRTIDVQPNKPTKLIFFGDIHRDSPNFAKSSWRDFLAYAKANLKHSYFVMMGDYIDSMSTSERMAIARSDLHETTRHTLDQTANNAVALLGKELDFMRGRVVVALNGNHFYQYSSGINSDQKLCEKLDAPYGGVCAFVRMTCKRPNGHTQSLDLWLHHGAGGGGRLLGGDINRIDQCREHADADIYAMGHTHKRMVVASNPQLRLKVSNQNNKLKLTHRQQWLLRTGSFLASYEDGVASYNVDAGRGPCSLGWVELEITPRRVQTKKGEKQESEYWLDIRGIS